MAEPEARTAGFFESLRKVGEAALALLQGRLEILSIELQEEKQRILQHSLWLCVALSILIMGVVLAALALAAAAYTLWGVLGLIVLALVVLLAGAISVWLVVRHLKSGPIPFATTLDELKKDRECLRGKQ